MDVRGFWGIDYANNFQLDARRQFLEHAAAATKQHRDVADFQLVQHVGFESPLRYVRAKNVHVSNANSAPFALAWMPLIAISWTARFRRNFGNGNRPNGRPASSAGLVRGQGRSEDPAGAGSRRGGALPGRQ